MKIFYETGFAIDKNVEAVVNSANGYLLLGGSGSGRIREVSGRFGIFEFFIFYYYLFRLPKNVRSWILTVYKKNKWYFTIGQLDCIRLLIKNNSKAYLQGEAVAGHLTIQNKIIIHAIGIGIVLDDMGNQERSHATAEILQKAVHAALAIAKTRQVKSVSMPVMCVRDGYGLDVVESFSVIKEELQFFKNDFDVVIICFDNPKSEEYLNNNMDIHSHI